ncbi:MAG: hypothetical protein R3F01_01040 [Lysobacteraceae bacterium]
MARNGFRLGGLLLACWFSATMASVIIEPGPWDPGIGEPRPWAEVEAVRQAAESGRGMAFSGRSGRLLFADDQRVARIYSDKWAFLGSYTREGNRLSIRFNAVSADLSALDADGLARYQTGAAQYRERAAARAVAAGVESVADPAEPRVITREQYLLVSLPDGDVLVDDDEDLRHRLRRWKAGDVLELHTWWAGSEVLQQRSALMQFADPLNAGLPVEMTRLLTPGTIEVQLVDVLDSEETVAWEGEYGSVRVRLDRGEDNGVFPEMRFWGLPPDEGLQLHVVESQADHAIARIAIKRFAPGDPVELPTVGTLLASREPGAKPAERETPTQISVSGRVLSAERKTDDPAFDTDWAIFITLTLDVGRDSGFSLGDSVFHEGYFGPEFVGPQGAEGRVVTMDDSTTTVLLRVPISSPENGVGLPEVGREFGTAAWLAERMTESFGGRQNSPGGEG